MAKKKSTHSGQTEAGNTRDVKIERLGPVTIYKRGNSYFLYYRENKQSERRKVDGNLAVARATAAKVAAALGEQKPSPIGFERTTPTQLVAAFVSYVTDVQKLAWRSQDRYRAALQRFEEFCEAANVRAIDAVSERTVEDLVKWLRGQTRTRNGAKKGRKESYKLGGVKFILSTCRTAFNWAALRRMLPPYAENPFQRFPIDRLRDPDSADEGQRVFTHDQERDFFAACGDWQSGLFLTLSRYGLRVGELTHLLIEDVDFATGTILIASKTELFWKVKTARRRHLPLTADMRTLLTRLIGDRTSGFVFLNQEYFDGRSKPIARYATDRHLRDKLGLIAEELKQQKPDISERDLRKAVVAHCRKLGQIPATRIQKEFARLTKTIGCPEFTRAHDLRHLFSSRAQEQGANPLLVQELLGHTTLAMTKRYTHLGLDTKRQALERIVRTEQMPSETDATP